MMRFRSPPWSLPSRRVRDVPFRSWSPPPEPPPPPPTEPPGGPPLTPPTPVYPEAIVQADPGLYVKRIPDITQPPISIAFRGRRVTVLETGIPSPFPNIFREWWKIIDPLGNTGYAAAIGPRGEQWLEFAPTTNTGHLVPAPPTPPVPEEQPKKQELHLFGQLRAAVKQVTPALILVGIGTGFAFAIGSGIGSAVLRELGSKKKRKRK